MPRHRPLPHRRGAPQAACVRQCGLDQVSHEVHWRRQRRPIAIAAALDDHRGVRRGFLPRGLCNTCPDTARACDHLRARAGVTQALTSAVIQVVALKARSWPGLPIRVACRQLSLGKPAIELKDCCRARLRTGSPGQQLPSVNDRFLATHPFTLRLVAAASLAFERRQPGRHT